MLLIPNRDLPTTSQNHQALKSNHSLTLQSAVFHQQSFLFFLLESELSSTEQDVPQLQFVFYLIKRITIINNTIVPVLFGASGSPSPALVTAFFN